MGYVDGAYFKNFIFSKTHYRKASFEEFYRLEELILLNLGVELPFLKGEHSP
jgi:hypothetical protein